jgi:hypothetical protein
MKHMNVDELNVVAFTPRVSRRDKLIRWANLIRCTNSYLNLYHRLEYLSHSDLRAIRLDGAPYSAFTVAINDPEFKALGLGTTMGSVMDFFEITQHDLHKFSCDCGGSIDKCEMADRIERLGK